MLNFFWLCVWTFATLKLVHTDINHNNRFNFISKNEVYLTAALLHLKVIWQNFKVNRNAFNYNFHQWIQYRTHKALQKDIKVYWLIYPNERGSSFPYIWTLNKLIVR